MSNDPKASAPQERELSSEATWGEIEAVMRGAALLDSRYPAWWNEIDTVVLDINSHYACILAQLYGSYYSGLEFLELESVGAAKDCAFMPELDHEDTLTSLWVRAIQWRMVKP